MDDRRTPHHLYWVTPDVAGGEYPGAPEPAHATARVRALTDQGVTLFVDLTEEGELVPYASALQGARHVRCAIPDVRTPTDSDVVRDALDAIDAEVAAGGRAYVHCWGGVGRTGTIVGCWLVRRGRTGADALDEVQRLYGATAKARRLPRSPETAAQRAYVMGWERIHGLERRAVDALAAHKADPGDADDALDALLDASEDAFVRVLEQALVHTSHRRHQRVARALQAARRASTVPFVRRACALGVEHLAYTASDDDVIAKWFSWILADIGTPEAIALLHELTAHPNPAFAAEMRYRLERIGASPLP